MKIILDRLASLMVLTSFTVAYVVSPLAGITVNAQTDQEANVIQAVTPISTKIATANTVGNSINPTFSSIFLKYASTVSTGVSVNQSNNTWRKGSNETVSLSKTSGWLKTFNDSYKLIDQQYPKAKSANQLAVTGQIANVLRYLVPISTSASSSYNVVTSLNPTGQPTYFTLYLVPIGVNSTSAYYISTFPINGTKGSDSYGIFSDAFANIPLGTYDLYATVANIPVLANTPTLTNPSSKAWAPPYANLGDYKVGTARNAKIGELIPFSPSACGASCVKSPNSITITPAPELFVGITSPQMGEVWPYAVIHKITWIANFVRGTNNTGIAKYNGVREVPFYGKYDFSQNGNPDSNAIAREVGIAVAEIVLNNIPVVGWVASIALSLADEFGAFDDNAPQIVDPVYLNAIPYNTTTGTIPPNVPFNTTKTIPGVVYHLSPTVTNILENGYANVNTFGIPSGTYVIQLIAFAGNGDGVNYNWIVATSTPFVLVSTAPTSTVMSDLDQSPKTATVWDAIGGWFGWLFGR